MTAKETMNWLEKELVSMRSRFDSLRVQGNLGKMDARDKLLEFKEALEPTYEKAKSSISELVRDGAEESKVLANSLGAAWDELRQAHRRLSEEAELERAEAHEEKRHKD